jgi:nucleotide-binding universal stress UspA family protein
VKEVKQMYQTILVPLDGSRRAEKILPYVEDVARRFEATVVLLQVVELSTAEMFAESADAITVVGLIEEHSRQAQTYLASIRADLLAQGLQVQTLVEYGIAVATILEVAERIGADLIAMASHGFTGLTRVFYGSVAAGVLHRVDRPLLLIRAQDEEPDPKTIHRESSPRR